MNFKSAARFYDRRRPKRQWLLMLTAATALSLGKCRVDHRSVLRFSLIEARRRRACWLNLLRATRRTHQPCTQAKVARIGYFLMRVPDVPTLIRSLVPPPASARLEYPSDLTPPPASAAVTLSA